MGPMPGTLDQEGRGASLGGLSAIAYTLVEMIEREGSGRRRAASCPVAPLRSPCRCRLRRPTGP